MRGVQCYILAPLKGHEFKRACHKIGGTYIKLAPGSSACINVMEIRPTLTPEMELIDELDYSDIDSMLAKKIQQLMIFFSLLIPDMSNEEEQLLDEALVKTYANFGITGDLYEVLKESPLTARLATIVSRFVTGSAQSFNRQSNINLSNRYVVLDISELKGKMLPVGMMIALDYVWDQVKADRTKKKMVFIDEIWKLIGLAARQTGRRRSSAWRFSKLSEGTVEVQLQRHRTCPISSGWRMAATGGPSSITQRRRLF